MSQVLVDEVDAQQAEFGQHYGLNRYGQNTTGAVRGKGFLSELAPALPDAAKTSLQSGGETSTGERANCKTSTGKDARAPVTGLHVLSRWPPTPRTAVIKSWELTET